MNIKKIVFLFVGINLFCLNDIFCQVKNYIIITMEMTQNKKIDGLKSTQWIIPEDSLNSFSSKNIYPFFVESFSVDNLINCKEKIKINPFSFTTATNFNFEKNLRDSLDFLSKLIRLNRKKIQMIKKNYITGYKEVIKVYATPISAKVCNCEYYEDFRNDIGHSGLLFLPISNFQEYNIFWQLPQSNSLKSIDLSPKNKFNSVWQ